MRLGIICDVLQDISTDTIRESIFSSIKIREIHRLNRRVKINEEIKYVPSRTVCLKFEGQSLLHYIFLFSYRYIVSPFVPKARICFSCFRIDHLSKDCKSNPRYIICGKPKHKSETECESRNYPIKCINCGGNHLATSHECEEVIKHKTILSRAATENISLSEARKSLGTMSSASFDTISDLRFDFLNFPILTRTSRQFSPTESPFKRAKHS